MKTDARFSDCRTWRYVLTREWSEPAIRPLVVIGLNPSTADETKDDPTIRRCIRFARDWGHDGLVMLNLFALRSTDPKALYRADDPIGPDNDTWIKAHATGSTVLAAWGTHGTLRARGLLVRSLVRRQPGVTLVTLGLTKEGHPKHPLYIAANTQPVEW